MKNMTIEERAKEACEGYDDQAYSAGLYMGYKEGADDQFKIDIERTCLWLKNRVEYSFTSDIIEGFKEFMNKIK